MLIRHLFLFMLMLVVLRLNAQVPEEDPQFPGGGLALERYLQGNPIYSTDTTCIGKLWVEFTVDSTGFIVDPRIAKGLCAAANEEAVRLVRRMPQWEPGRILGRSVPVKLELGITVGVWGKKTPNRDQVVPVDCSTVTDSNHVFMSWQVDELPEFIGGDSAYITYCTRHLEYPVDCDCNGTVYMTIIIERTGEVSEPYIKRGVCKCHDDEALRVMKKMPPWKPGRCNGVPVRVQMHQAVRFELD